MIGQVFMWFVILVLGVIVTAITVYGLVQFLLLVDGNERL